MVNSGMNTNQTTSTASVASRLVELCSAGEWHTAIHDLYGDDARHVEAMEAPGFPRVTTGKPAVLAAAERWSKNTTVHSCSVGMPLVNGDQFLVEMKLDCTSHEGPMAGQRMQMAEQCLYTVRDGLIREAKFFYPGCA